MSSRHPAALGARSHDRAARKRNRRDAVALRRATAGDHAAYRACRNVGRWLAGHDDATAGAILCAAELIRRALVGHQHIDGDLVARLEQAVERIELHTEAHRLDMRPDALAEVRMLAREIAARLLPA
jgi:hypothetical protein